MPRSRRVTIYWSREVGEDEECFEVECSVGPAEPRGTPYAGYREVEIIEVRDSYGLRPDVIPQIPEAEVERIYSEAIDDVCDQDEQAYHDEMDLRMEQDRDARLLGDRIY